VQALLLNDEALDRDDGCGGMLDHGYTSCVDGGALLRASRTDA